jgi:hypothetical protein
LGWLKNSGWGETGNEKNSEAQGLDVFRHKDGFDAVRVFGVLDAKGAHFSAFTQHGVTAHDDVLVHKNFLTPLLHAGVHLEGFAIGGRGG